MKKRPHSRYFVLLIASLTSCSLLAASCGSDDDSSSGGSASTAAATATTATGATTATSTEATTDSSTDATTDATTEETTDASTETTADSEPAAATDPDAEFNYAINFSLFQFDPDKALAAVATDVWLRPVYEHLLEVVKSGDGTTFGPQLATSFKVADDGLSINFELREGVKFQDGTPFNADAVKANIERAKGPDSTVSSVLENVESVEVVDDTHVVFHLSKPDPYIPYAMANNSAGCMISPAAFDSDLATHPVGTGPFTLVSAQDGGDVVYERWDGHWDPNAALVKKLVISTVPDANARYNGLQSGTYDAAFLSPPTDLAAKDLESDGYHYLLNVEPSPHGILLNGTKAPFDDVRVRRAVSMALNRQEIADQLYEGLSVPAFQTFLKGYTGYDPALDKDPYDPDAARQLLKDAGVEGTTVTFVQLLTPPIDQLAEVVQQALGDIGLTVKLEPFDASEARTTWATNGYDGIVAGFAGQPEPSQTLSLEYIGGDNPATPPTELVKMADEAIALPFGSTERDEAYQAINRYLAENPIHVPLVSSTSVIVARPEVVGSDLMAPGTFLNLNFRGVGIASK